MMKGCYLLLISTQIWAATAFYSPQFFSSAAAAARSSSTRVFGINEWRDTLFDVPQTSDALGLGKETEGALKEICILPFPYDEVLLQGETKQLRLYEERFIKLFDYCMEKHSGVVAMGLIAQTGIIQTVPICEIEAYNRLDGFGIFVTIRVVGRAQLGEIVQQEPYLTGVCRELSDTIPSNLELPNLVASNVENFMLLLSSMEHRLSKAMDGNEDDEDEEDAEMRKRIQIAKLVRALPVE
jgi:Lon protease-like protein